MSTAFRLTLELAEETRARWQHAADRAGFTLDEWMFEYLGAASDPDAGQVTATGTPGAQQTQSDCGGHDFCQRDELLARVEAAEGVVRMASAYRMIESGELTRALGMGEPLPTEIAAARAKLDDALAEYQAARAALACPPQQRGE